MTILKNMRGVGAMTLTELLVSVILIGIIMLGIVSIDFATKQSQQTTTRSGLVAMQTGAMMMNITKAISLATGNSTNAGITANGAGAPFNGPEDLCVRQDLNSSEVPNNTPNNFADDTWACFDFGSNQLSTCRRTSSGVCNPPTNPIVIGSLVSMTVSVTANPIISTQSFYVDVTLTGRYDPSSAANYLNNPQYVLQSRVYPGSHSWTTP